MMFHAWDMETMSNWSKEFWVRERNGNKSLGLRAFQILRFDVIFEKKN